MSYIATLKGIEVLAGAVGEFHGADSSKAMRQLMAAVEAEYMEELLDAEPARVVQLQVAVKQLRALRDVLAAKSANPRI